MMENQALIGSAPGTEPTPGMHVMGGMSSTPVPGGGVVPGPPSMSIKQDPEGGKSVNSMMSMPTMTPQSMSAAGGSNGLTSPNSTKRRKLDQQSSVAMGGTPMSLQGAPPMPGAPPGPNPLQSHHHQAMTSAAAVANGTPAPSQSMIPLTPTPTPGMGTPGMNTPGMGAQGMSTQGMSTPGMAPAPVPTGVPPPAGTPQQGSTPVSAAPTPQGGTAAAAGAQIPMNSIRTPHAHDVLCGRGGGTNNHIGNENFRELVNEKKRLYLNSSKREKPLVSKSIVEAVRMQNPPGRFLSKDEKTGLWYDIGDQKAREKTSQALREGAPVIRKEMVQSAAAAQSPGVTVPGGVPEMVQSGDAGRRKSSSKVKVEMRNLQPMAGYHMPQMRQQIQPQSQQAMNMTGQQPQHNPQMSNYRHMPNQPTSLQPTPPHRIISRTPSHTANHTTLLHHTDPSHPHHRQHSHQPPPPQSATQLPPHHVHHLSTGSIGSAPGGTVLMTPGGQQIYQPSHSLHQQQSMAPGGAPSPHGGTTREVTDANGYTVRYISTPAHAASHHAGRPPAPLTHVPSVSLTYHPATVLPAGVPIPAPATSPSTVVPQNPAVPLPPHYEKHLLLQDVMTKTVATEGSLNTHADLKQNEVNMGLCVDAALLGVEWESVESALGDGSLMMVVARAKEKSHTTLEGSGGMRRSGGAGDMTVMTGAGEVNIGMSVKI